MGMGNSAAKQPISPRQRTTGNFLGALLLILGDIASRTELVEPEARDAVFKACREDVEVTLTASANRRSVRIQNV